MYTMIVTNASNGDVYTFGPDEYTSLISLAQQFTDVKSIEMTVCPAQANCSNPWHQSAPSRARMECAECAEYGEWVTRYAVQFEDATGRERGVNVALTAGYTTFADIPKIISIRYGVGIADMKIIAVIALS